MAFDLKSTSLTASRRLLRPVIRLLLRAGVTWKDFTELAKTVFVEVATEEFGIRGRPTNMARVAILTGINRREVARQRSILDGEVAQEPTYLNAAQRLLSAWHQEDAYLDAVRRPREIPIDGPAPSFADLCGRHGGDLPDSALLKELRAVGALRVTGDTATVLMRTYIPVQMDPDKVLRAGDVLNDIGTTVVHDLICPPGQPLRFERRAENDCIDPRCLPEFRVFLEREGQAFLERIDDWLTSNSVSPQNCTDVEPIRLGVGVYHIQTSNLSGALQ
jgi:hypothetical protein